MVHDEAKEGRIFTVTASKGISAIPGRMGGKDTPKKVKEEKEKEKRKKRKKEKKRKEKKRKETYIFIVSGLRKRKERGSGRQTFALELKINVTNISQFRKSFESCCPSLNQFKSQVSDLVTCALSLMEFKNVC